MDHFKGKRKQAGISAKKDLRVNPDATINVHEIDYWKELPN